ncbi:hypothetical protein [Niallia taxi]|uniref:hypothetical protein n=1 Tax=Niallia taxi TaxID=2499688 RepID=UPI00300858B3
MTIQLIHNVRGSKEYKRGSIVSFPEAEEKRLVSVGVARYFEGEAVVQQQDNEYEDISPEEYEKIYKLLNEAANKDPLITAAIAVGVELSDDDKKRKDTVIERIIEQGMDEVVLHEINKGE